MPRYSLVGCSSCNAFKVVDGNPKTTVCTNCEKQLKFRKLKRFYESDDTHKVSQAKAILLARREGEEDKIAALIEAGALDEDIVQVVSDKELLSAHGVDVEEADSASDLSSPRPPSREDQVYIALGEVEHSTKENVSAYLENEYGTDPTKIETVIDSLYLRGDLLRSPDGTYSSV